MHKYIYIRAVRLIEIEIKSWFELARFLNRFIARFFPAPCPNLPQYAIRTNQNAAEQNRPGIQTDSMLKKQGRWVQNRIRTWWPKKCMLHAEHTAGSSDHISFRAESFFLKILYSTFIQLLDSNINTLISQSDLRTRNNCCVYIYIYIYIYIQYLTELSSSLTFF